jgi:hypothetical protein
MARSAPGGYTGAILDAAPEARVLAIDRDATAVAAGSELAAAHSGRLTLREGRFGDLDLIAEANGFAPADGVVLDIGVSSMQIDDPARGFSFQKDGPLDMRMSASGPHRRRRRQHGGRSASRRYSCITWARSAARAALPVPLCGGERDSIRNNIRSRRPGGARARP